MNQKNKLLTIALFLGLITQSKAQNLNSSVIETQFYLAKMIPAKSANSVRVYIKNKANKKLQLTIKNIEGTEILGKFLSQKRPRANFKVDLANVPNGIYLLELLDDNNNRSWKFFRKENETIAAGLSDTLLALY